MSSRVRFHLSCKIKTMLQLCNLCKEVVLQRLAALLIGIDFIKLIGIDKIFAIEATKW